ncbi:HD domain-containing protein [Thermodesulfatator atlanticus]|uniref:HD domain-containing protein n=1 Tax=Thermodesulfatator atlanticus TaxID=501497 RepID=UPI00041DA971|nr:HD domain-containing protein [Thermodesulfatator atlanticus]
MKKISRVPDVSRCYEILHENGVPPHIIAHCEKVSLVACYLTEALCAVGEDLDLALVKAASLLHDVTKHISLKTGENHATSAAKLLTRLGYPEVAKIVAQHIFLTPGPPGSPIREEEIVYYADKRVMHDKIVTLKERFEDLKMRYGKNPSSIVNIERLYFLTKLLERRLFKKLPFGPERLLELDHAQSSFTLRRELS